MYSMKLAEPKTRASVRAIPVPESVTKADANLEVGRLHFHWLRHSFASSLISAGCSVKAVADAMGHENPAVTLKVYASLWPGDEDRVRSAIAAAWETADQLRTSEAVSTL